jgi:anti-sigma factor RsiW
VTCRELVEFLMAYVDGELSEAERTEFHSHLAQCPPCVAYLKTYELTIRLTKRAMECQQHAPPEPCPEELVRAILAARAAAGGTDRRQWT